MIRLGPSIVLMMLAVAAAGTLGFYLGSPREPDLDCGKDRATCAALYDQCLFFMGKSAQACDAWMRISRRWDEDAKRQQQLPTVDEAFPPDKDPARQQLPTVDELFPPDKKPPAKP